MIDIQNEDVLTYIMTKRIYDTWSVNSYELERAPLKKFNQLLGIKYVQCHTKYDSLKSLHQLLKIENALVETRHRYPSMKISHAMKI